MILGWQLLSNKAVKSNFCWKSNSAVTTKTKIFQISKKQKQSKIAKNPPQKGTENITNIIYINKTNITCI